MSFDSKTFLKNLTTQPGVYQMFSEQGELLYVGKARNLKKRLSSYFRKTLDSPKTAAMMEQVVDIKTLITNNENDALLLEANLIKEHTPKYNILFRDDKSYPYLVLKAGQGFPRLAIYRGRRNKQDQFYGPFPNGFAVKKTLNLLQKLFKIRQCSDSYFSNRVRPCLQHQIKRCTAPCVGLVTPEQYQEQVEQVKLFLSGKSQTLVHQLIEKMETAAKNLNYELAAKYRDQIAELRSVQSQQAMEVADQDVDVILVLREYNVTILGLLMVRHGQVLGQKTFYPKHVETDSLDQVLNHFIGQYYLTMAETIPNKIMVFDQLSEKELLAGALRQVAGHRVLLVQGRGELAQRWHDTLRQNLSYELSKKHADKVSALAKLDELTKVLKLAKPLRHLECFDISHALGEATVASCVVFNTQGLAKALYRKFNINDVTKGDDYAAMRQALTRRYQRILKEGQTLPDMVVIDGGKGQLQQAVDVFQELGVQDVLLLGVAKGADRKPGFEKLWLAGQPTPVLLEATSSAFHLLQQIRDEAHRFAITSHRAKRAKIRQTSSLEDIPGVGAKRRRDILSHFGGMQQLKKAGVAELTKVSGISRQLAEKIIKELNT